MERKCDACGNEKVVLVRMGGAKLCRKCFLDIQPEIERRNAEGKPVNVMSIAQALLARKNNIYTAIKHLNASIMLMEKSKSAYKSKTIALARAEAEKAREILAETL